MVIKVTDKGKTENIKVRVIKEDLGSLAWIKNYLQIDETTNKEEAQRILRDNEINNTSWVLSALARVYGEDWAASYRASIANLVCFHGFIGDCSYCKWGTE